MKLINKSLISKVIVKVLLIAKGYLKVISEVYSPEVAKLPEIKLFSKLILSIEEDNIAETLELIKSVGYSVILLASNASIFAVTSCFVYPGYCMC